MLKSLFGCNSAAAPYGSIYFKQSYVHCSNSGGGMFALRRTAFSCCCIMSRSKFTIYFDYEHLAVDKEFNVTILYITLCCCAQIRTTCMMLCLLRLHAAEAIMFSLCPVVCPDVVCQRRLVRRASESTTHV